MIGPRKAVPVPRKFVNIFITVLTTTAVWLLLYQHSVELIYDSDKDELKTGHIDRQRYRRWPPDNMSEIIHPKLKLFDLTLRPLVLPRTVNRQPWDSYYRILRMMHPEIPNNGSQLKQLYLLNKEQRDRGWKPDYDAYPQSLDIAKAVNAVKSGKSVDQPPINDPEMLVVTSPKMTCNSSRGSRNSPNYPLDLVILVKSCFSCDERRHRARSTYMQRHLWKGFRVQFAFVLGIPSFTDPDTFQFEGVNISNTWKKLVNTDQREQESRKLQQESAVYNDLLIGNLHDTYYNLTLKLIFTFRWASVFCEGQTPLFLFLDDDSSVIPANLVSYIKAISSSDKVYLNGGFFRGRMPVTRPKKDPKSNRWSVSDEEFPWNIYPPYSSGAGYLVGAELVRDAAIAMAFTRYYRIDDAYLGIVWMKLRYPLAKIPGFRENMKLDEFNNTLVASAIALDKFMDWKTGTPKNAVKDH